MKVNEPLLDRLGLLLGLALTTVIAAWWLGSTRLALEYGASATVPAQLAMLALLLTRALVLAPLALRTAALRGYRHGAVTSLALITAPWPLLLLAWSASAAPLARIALAEACLLLSSALLPLAGAGLRRWLPQPQQAALASTVLGIALAAGAWASGSAWVASMLWAAP